jgi:uncharacterized protein (TIGR02284 family)
MHAREESAVKLLYGLIETTLESAHGYEEAADSAREGRLRTLFSERSRRRMDLARQLQQEVRTFGATAEEGRPTPGEAREAFRALKAALLGEHDQAAVLRQLERGEDVVKSSFELAMNREDLPATAWRVVSRAYECVRADHDEISRLKQAMQ